MAAKIKIGVLIDSYNLPLWKYNVLRDLIYSDYAVISLIVLNPNPDMDRDERIRRIKGSMLFKWHRKADRFIFGFNEDYDKIVSVKPLFQGIPEMKSDGFYVSSTGEFSYKCLQEIAEIGLDVIVKFGFSLIKGEILNTPRYGVWSYPMDDHGNDKTSTAGYYEVIRGESVTRSELVILSEDKESDIIISSSWTSTCSYSIHINRDRLFSRASLFLPRVIEGIYKHGGEFLEVLQKRYNNKNDKRLIPLDPPDFWSSLVNILSALRILTRKVFKKLIYSDPFSWELLLKTTDNDEFQHISFANFYSLKPSRDKFWADPFVIHREGRYFIFVEEFVYSRNKGHISVLELDLELRLKNVHHVMEKKYHMSYPFIFESAGELFMIPETGGNRTIDLYRCTRFPDKWELMGNIMKDVNAVDTTVFYYEGRWWLFTVIEKLRNSPEGSPELYLYFTTGSDLDHWESHPCNPVVTDIRTARPAGKLFVHNDRIYRPSQDCSGRYGEAINFNEVLVLSETDYQEILVTRVSPDWDRRLTGMHTFNFDGDLNIIDAYKMRRRPVFSR